MGQALNQSTRSGEDCEFTVAKLIGFSDLLDTSAHRTFRHILETDLLKKIFAKSPLALAISPSGAKPIFVRRIAHYYIKCFDFVPYFCSERDGMKKSEDYKEYVFSAPIEPYVAAINSSAFYFYWQVLFDAFKTGKLCVKSFPLLPFSDASIPVALIQKAGELMRDIKQNANRLKAEYKATGAVEYDQFFPRYSKPIMDEIDTVLAGHYGFTPEELDFILNYDIKYRITVAIAA